MTQIVSRRTIVLLVWVLAGWGFGWEVPAGTMRTPWTSDVSPEKVLQEYPRPQMQRDNWLNLNGLWQYQQAQADDKPPFGKTLNEQILVPFPVEAPLSGIKRWDDRMWYRRIFKVPGNWAGQRVHLFFGAVDWQATVYVNGTKLGMHRGGYDSFSFDITDHLKAGENELIVGVVDRTGSDQVKGKQTRTLGRYSYTASSGIWQTVWLETTGDAYVTDLKMVTDIAENTLQLTVKTTGGKELSVEAVAYDGTTPVGRAMGHPTQTLRIPVPNAKLWSPDGPFLYDLKITLRSDEVVVDRISSYFGMRQVKLVRLNGVVRPVLNGTFVYQTGTLDQGWWPDGLYTAPTDEALKFDIQIHKDMGFNMVRKHVKVEPQRWYYWCDKLGLLVWQDMPHRGAFDPDDRSTVTDAEYAEILKNLADAEDPIKGNGQFEYELRAMVRQHFNSPSIIQWVIFNEGWGVYDRDRVTQMVRDIDGTRIIGTLTGGEDKGGFIDTGAGDVRDHHTYGPDPAWQIPNPDLTANAFRISVLGEYGGVESHVKGHLWGEINREGIPPEQMTDRYITLQEKLRPHIRTRLSAAACTQITDVETELNGLWTYDRKVSKVDVDRIRQVNRSMIAEGEKENTNNAPGQLTYGDLGTGYFRNPVLIGAQGDVTVVRGGPDYYCTHGRTLEIYHSQDLVNWEKISKVLPEDEKRAVWAPDITYVDGTFYVYTTLVDRSRTDGKTFMNVVFFAKNPAGPWSEPIDLRIYGQIDPGHLTAEDGKRYLYVNKGKVVQLTTDGIATMGELVKVYEGWQYPADWQVECFCLEAPKLLLHDGYYYLLSAEGGTAGPPTAHMAVVARSTSPTGPWGDSPYNPLVHTASKDEVFWRQGHGQLIDDVEGNWWMLYTGYNKDIGPNKLTLLVPMVWTEDGWPIVKPGVDVTDVMMKPLYQWGKRDQKK